MIPDVFVLQYFYFLYTQKKNSRFLKFQKVRIHDYKKTIILYLDRRQPSVSLKQTTFRSGKTSSIMRVHIIYFINIRIF